MRIRRQVTDELAGFEAVAVAVSGGRDSMALLRWVGDNYVGRYFAVHVNHNLRGEESARDESFVREYCRGRGIELKVFDVDVAEFCRAHGYGIEQGARLVRREIFASLVEEGEVRRVLTAHHADDNAESILMHVFRGCGIDGLRGIGHDDGKLFRPFLEVDGEDIDEYVAREGVPYIIDCTNADTSYARNRIRLKVIPEIKKAYPGLNAALARLSRHAEQCVKTLDEEFEIRMDGGAAVIPAEIFVKNDFIVSRAIFAALERVGGRVDATSKHIDAVMRLGRGLVGGKICLPRGLRAAREADGVAVWYAEEKNGDETRVEKKAQTVFAGSWAVIIDFGSDLKYAKSKTDGAWGKELYCDGDKLEGCVVRSRREGDKFRKFGGGQKSLGDYFTDIKMPPRLRDELPIIADGSDVEAVCGVEISSDIAVTEATVNYGKITLIRMDDFGKD